MQNISKFYNLKQVAKFQKAIPNLRKKIGKEKWSENINEFGIAGNTFRAFRTQNYKPSDLYRTWAKTQCQNLNRELLETTLESKIKFDEWHNSLSESLQKNWKQKEGDSLSVAHKYKIIDLYVKWLSKFTFGSIKITDGFIAYAHCALDSQILTKLNDCLSDALPLNNPSMGHIKDENTYIFCQELISNFSYHCGGTPLLFDYYAWSPGGK